MYHTICLIITLLEKGPLNERIIGHSTIFYK